MMRVLALDTSTRAGGVALVEDHRVLDERLGDAGRTHGERLPREILDLLDRCGLTTADVDLFAVACGPGSFTGLRIGIATQQGLAFVHRRPMAAVSALEALAHAASGEAAPGSVVAAWMDAQRRDVFSAVYRVAPFDVFDPRRLVEIDQPQVAAPAVILERWRKADADRPAVFIGDGATAFADSIGAAYPDATIMPHPALAGAIGRIGAAQAAQGRVTDPAAIRALYIRRPDAEVEREKRQTTR
ncbi:MAG: tRNA (adenosine(37)-N6)-threonylcarbamoyltransferase complex dimerization subunit type 1 TsaB [Acidobacteriota bacterium]